MSKTTLKLKVPPSATPNPAVGDSTEAELLKEIQADLIPQISKASYEKCWNKFDLWAIEHKPVPYPSIRDKEPTCTMFRYRFIHIPTFIFVAAFLIF